MEIHKTKDYSQFKKIKGNREVNKNWIAFLTKRMAEENLMEQNPAIVNEKKEIIDGQHRLEICKANNWWFYYTIKEGANLETLQKFNTAHKSWGPMDYAKSYADQGNVNYQKLLFYFNEYHFSLTNLRLFFAKYADYRVFKRGEMVIENEEEGFEKLSAYLAIREFVDPDAFKDRDLIRAFLQMIQKASIKDLINKCSFSGKIIERQSDTKSYLRALEDILNWKQSQNIIRLY